jgi:hypothetical protein
VNVPAAVGVPLMVMTFADQEAVTPAGKPVAGPIPVAPVVVCVMEGSKSPRQIVGDAEAAVTVFTGVTSMSTEPCTGVRHEFGPVKETLIREYVAGALNAGVVKVAVPAAFKEMVEDAPPFT